MPTREDVDLARAAIDRGFLTIQESVKCLEIQRDHEKAGRHIPLVHIFVEAKLLSPEQLASLKESLARSAALHRIGHYELLSKLGAGGMGTVYKAKDLKADRIVALKVLSPGHAGNRQSIVRFLREAHASGRLSHPNVIQGYDAGEVDGQFYFAMEFIDGITVGDMLKDGRPVPEQQALDIAIQIAKALDHAEEQHLVHGDIKPDNLMLTSDGTAKLADLGLARLAAERPGQHVKTALGTVYYASPEQCEGEAGLDTKADMYSFGATLFHMLAGRVPFDDESLERIMTKHLRAKPPYLKDLNVQLSHGVSKIVRKLLAKNKRNRYPAMSEVVKDLTLVRMGRSPRLGERSRYDSGEYRYRSSTGSWRTRRPSRRKKFLLVSACVIGGLGALVGGAIWFESQWPGAPRHNTIGGAPVPTTRPKSAAEIKEREAEIYLAQIAEARDRLPREEFRDQLLSVAEKYPGTPSAQKAQAEAARIFDAMEAAARADFGACKGEAETLRDRQEFQAALERIDRFPAKHHRTGAAREAADLRKAIETQARTAFVEIQGRSRELAKEKKFDEAVAAYQPVLERFGIAKMADDARTALREIEQARAAEEKRLAEEARERERQEKIRKDRLARRAAVGNAGKLVGESKIAEAAKTLNAAARKLVFRENRPSLQRAAADLHGFVKFVAALRKNGKAFKDKTLKLTLKDGTKIEGDVFRSNENSLSLRLAGSTAIRGVSWEELSLDTVRQLAETAGGGKLAAADRCAVAAVLFFSGRADEADAELDKLAADLRMKKTAELRRKDYALFAIRE